MKTLFKTFAYAAIAALALSSCAKEKLQPADELIGKLVTVHFGTENTDPSTTRATLTPNAGETAFQAAWENGDVLSIEYISPKPNNAVIDGTWDEKNKKFSATLPNETGAWAYQAAYPVPSASDNSVDFGANRTQRGNSYNSKYDIMIGAVDTKNSAAGKDDEGKDIVFPMTRQTAIAYFHFTSDLDESVVSATLTVTGGAIANSAASIKDFKFVAPQDNNLTEINLTFEDGTAPSAKDFQLWFNVLETSYESMTLTVETKNKTFTISKNTNGEPDMYEVGKLYKVKKAITADKWTNKGGSDTPTTVTDVITSSNLVATDTNYKDFSDVNITSNAVYAGQSAKSSNGGIQLKSKNNNSGIVTTVSGGKARKITIVNESGTNTIDVYGKATPYTNVTELYATESTKQGTKLGSLKCGTDTELVISEDYPYIGIRSNNGALYLTSITITWEADGGSTEPTPELYTINFSSVEGGSLSASVTSAEADAEITLTATPDAGYEFNNDWTVTAADNSSIQVTDGKFIMPAQDVTVSASFSISDVLEAYPYSESFAESQGDFTINDVTLPSASTYVWSYTTYSGGNYMKASAYVSGTNYAAESWLISPVIDMSSAVKPILSFMTVARYGSNENLTLWAREKGGDWAQLSFSNYGSGKDWTFVSNTVDVSAYAGKTLQFAYKYVSTTSGASTWEIKNVEVKEQGAAATLTSIAWTGYSTSYTVGDTFNADGTVTATYSDGSSADVTSEASFSSPDMSTEGTKTVTVSYEGETTTGEITVKAASTGGATIITLYKTGFENNDEHTTSQNSYGTHTYGKWTTTYADMISNTSMSGSYMAQGRVAKSTTNSPAITSANLLSQQSTITSVEFESKSPEAFTLKFEYSLDGNNWQEASYSPNKSTAKTNHIVKFDTPISTEDFRIRLTFAVSSTTKSNRDGQWDNIEVKGYINE